MAAFGGIKPAPVPGLSPSITVRSSVSGSFIASSDTLCPVSASSTSCTISRRGSSLTYGFSSIKMMTCGPSRYTVSASGSPACFPCKTSSRSSRNVAVSPSSFSPSMATMISPVRSPPRSAGESCTTSTCMPGGSVTTVIRTPR